MHVFLSYVLSLMCEAVLCLELVFAEQGQAHYKYSLLVLLSIACILMTIATNCAVISCVYFNDHCYNCAVIIDKLVITPSVGSAVLYCTDFSIGMSESYTCVREGSSLYESHGILPHCISCPVAFCLTVSVVPVLFRLNVSAVLAVLS